MKKQLAIIFITLAAVLTLGILEQAWISKSFAELLQKAELLSEKSREQTLTYEETEEINEWWTAKKKTLHIYIPHDDIRDVDYWLSEGAGYVKNGEYVLAYAQFAILLDAARTIPLSYRFNIENIF